VAGDRKGQDSIRINDQWRIALNGKRGSDRDTSGHLAEELRELGMSAAELARNLAVPTYTRLRRGHYEAVVSHAPGAFLEWRMIPAQSGWCSPFLDTNAALLIWDLNQEASQSALVL
jgi:hypothetical protein